MRTDHLYVPSNLPDGPVPLLVALHGGTGWGEQFQWQSGFDGLAQANGFLVVFPDDVGLGGNADMFDAHRIVAAGHSNGGIISYRLACELSDRIVDLAITTWSQCRNGTEVRLVAVTGAPHAWMGHPNSNPGLAGEPYPNLDASVVILEFLLNHPRG